MGYRYDTVAYLSIPNVTRTFSGLTPLWSSTIKVDIVPVVTSFGSLKLSCRFLELTGSPISCLTPSLNSERTGPVKMLAFKAVE